MMNLGKNTYNKRRLRKRRKTRLKAKHEEEAKTNFFHANRYKTREESDLAFERLQVANRLHANLNSYSHLSTDSLDKTTTAFPTLVYDIGLVLICWGAIYLLFGA